ncbi:M56 family metallopeptidase [Undibacterium cyanobacteriorum]|uniref:M56 family metallopeptidase n=1 Tax=Undibacterium cyanobacteriorum TaxID=3073561 RepID=A0ABY9RK30_9BURK|nr:M56 family metallopeptidase [Undibacterium sp. 20NA77.5]WMW80727.1 M56 family metallopeptidase [Undibacterium sp. 20NA77.5]
MISMNAAWVPVVGTALLHFVWQGALLALATALLLFVLRRANTKWRYLVASVALALCAALPTSYVVSHWPSVDVSAMSAAASKENANSIEKIAPNQETSALFQQHNTQAAETLGIDLSAFVQRQAPVVVTVWMLGMLGLFLRFIAGLVWVQQQVNHAKQSPSAEWQAKLDRFAEALYIKTPIRIGLSEHLESPMTAGWWRPMVILPSALATGMPIELVEALLAHEVAHIKRFDYLVNLLQSVVEIALFYHPAVWWISKQIRIEREQIADDLAAGLLGEPRRLALALSELEQFQFINPQPALSARGENLMLRIKRLIKPELSAKPFAWKLALPMLSISAACAALVAQASVPTTAAQPAMVASTAPTIAPLVVAHSAPLSIANPVISAPPPTAASTITEALSEVRGMEALPPVPEPDQKVAKRSKSDDEKDALTMALVDPAKEDVHYMSGGRSDRKMVEKLKRDNKGAFLWFREDGKSFVIRDPKVIAQLHDAQAPLEAVSKQMEEQGKKMEAQGKVMEEIGKQMESVQIKEPKFDRANDARMQAFERKMEALGRKMEVIAERMANRKNDEAREGDRAAMQKMQEQMQEMSKKLQAEVANMHIDQEALQKSLEPLKAYSAKMQDASKPMEQLGEEMGRLGEQMELKQREFQKKVKEIIQSAKKEGLVTAVPEA